MFGYGWGLLRMERLDGDWRKKMTCSWWSVVVVGTFAG